MVYLYHSTKAPRGKTFTAGTAEKLEGKNGWVDSPDKLDKKSTIQKLKSFFSKEK